jgi:hypothetical protein
MICRVLAICETEEQAEVVLAQHADATIVALTPLVDAWCERKGRTDASIEDLFDDRAVNREGAVVIERVEAIAAEIDRLFARRTSGLQCAQYLSFRSFFHYINSILDSFVLRSEQIAAVLRHFEPERVVVFHLPDGQFSGLTSQDRAPWGLTSRLLPHYARLAGIPVEHLEAPKVDPSLYNPSRDANVELLPQGPGQLAQLAGTIVARAKNMLRTKRANNSPRAQAGPDDVAAPILIASLFSDVVGAVYDVWKQEGGRVLNLGEAFPRAPDMSDEPYRSFGLALFRDVENDKKIRSLLTLLGLSLWPWLRDWFYQVCTVRYPQLLEWAERLRQVLLVERRFGRNTIILAGGWVEEHYVMARVADAANVPTVSYHYGGYLGYSLLPKHERYDFAECDYFIAGGPGAAATFARPAPQTRWNPSVKRARPIPTGIGWLESKAAKSAGEPVGRKLRVMLVLNALVGDCRDLGYVFHPEIAYWRFTRRVVERLAREPDIEILVKPPLTARYPQMPNPLLRWLEDHPHIAIVPDKPLAACLDEADAFILESPSTPLLVTIASDKPVAAYIDRSLYLFQEPAWNALSRRAFVLADTEAAFMERLEALLNSKTVWRAPSDRSFLNDYVDGGEGSSTRRMSDFLLSLTANFSRQAAAE